MTRRWLVSSPFATVVLDGRRRGQALFTVVNGDQRPGRVVLEVEPGEGADPTWFHVPEPHRSVPGQGAVAFPVGVTVPAGVPAGRYPVRARVIPAVGATGEPTVLSATIEVVVPPESASDMPDGLVESLAKLAKLLEAAHGIVVEIHTELRGARVLPPEVVVPPVTAVDVVRARAELTAAGLATGAVRHRHQPAGQLADGTVTAQSVAPGTKVPPGTPVDLIAVTRLAAPVIAEGDPSRIAWAQANPEVRRWHVTVDQQLYARTERLWRLCAQQTVTSATYTPPAGALRCTITALDDFGTAGPSITTHLTR